jgi:chorismate mutase
MTGPLVELHDLWEVDEPDPAARQRRLDDVDRQLVALVCRRTELARRVAAAEVADGRPGYSHARDLEVVSRFGQLGPLGHELAVLLMRMAR